MYRRNSILGDMKERARRKWQGLHADDESGYELPWSAYARGKKKSVEPSLKDRAREAFQRKAAEVQSVMAKRAAYDAAFDAAKKKKLEAEAAKEKKLQAEADAAERKRLQEQAEVKKEHPKAAMRRALKERFKKICERCKTRYGSDEDVLPTLIGEKCDECGEVFKGYLEDGDAGPVVSRTNPSLVILSNPDRVPGEAAARKAWAKFHLAGSRDAKVCSIPDVPGLPKTVVVLGACEGFEWQWHAADHGGKAVKFRRDMKQGPWLVTDIKAKRLWIVARSANQLRQVESDGFFKAIYYFPPSNSGKHDRTRGYRHEFGEGGRLPEHRWHEVYPKLVWRGNRAVEMVPVGAPFRITERGIVG